MFKKSKLLFFTLLRLKPYQIFYQILFRINLLSLFQKKFKIDEIDSLKINSWRHLKPKTSYYPSHNSFKFLNKEYVFDSNIDWNFSDFGNLWTYNLNYFDFINQKDLNDIQVNNLLFQYLNKYNFIKIGKDPYPTSLRIINLSKLISNRHNIDSSAYKILVMDIKRLSCNLEKHLLANHLLENLLALWVGSHFIKNKDLKKFINKKLQYQLSKQILDDGAHYELSPMYHQIILGRLLECISISKNNPSQWNSKMNKTLIQKSELMLGWLKNISFNFTHFIRINDSVEGVAPGYPDLINLAEKLEIKIKSINLNESKLRILKNNGLSMLIDLSNMSPSYQPGHSHSDSLNFILFYQNIQLIVDPGISTYEKNNFRNYERSSSYHNIVIVNNQNYDEIWDRFRVGRASKTKIIKDKTNNFKAIKKSYKKNIIHRREWLVHANRIDIIDWISVINRPTLLNLHFHPEVDIQIYDYKLLLNNNIEIQFQNHENIQIVDYFYAKGFNNRIKAKRAQILFKQNLVTSIIVK